MSTSRRTDVGIRLARRRRALGQAALLTGATTVATGCAHSLAGGAAPALLLLAAAFMATLALLAPVLGPATSWTRRVVAVAIAQAVQHGLYSLPQPSAPSASTPGHAHHDVQTLTAAALPTAAHAHGDMVLAHVLAGGVTLVALAMGASAVGAVVRALRGDRVVRLIALVAPLGAARPAPVAGARSIVRLPSSALRTPGARRGPPLLAV